MRRVLVATFNELESAQPLKEKLQQAGIQTFINDESKRERFWFLSEPLAAIHIFVPASDYLKAAGLIEQWQAAEGVLNNAVRCPECGSSRVEFPQLTRKFVTPSLGVLLMAIGLVPREFYCLVCHYTWPRVMRLEPAKDALGWPRESKLWHPKEKSPTHR